MPFIEREDTSAPIAAMIAGLLVGVFLNGVGVEAGWAVGAALLVSLVVWLMYESSNGRLATRNRNVIHTEEELWKDVRNRLGVLELGMDTVTGRMVDTDFTLWLYARHMARKGKPLERPFRAPVPGSPEEDEMNEAVDEWLREKWEEEPEAADPL